MRETALRERTISLASVLALEVSLRLAACLTDCLTLVCSRSILAMARSILRISARISAFHFLAASLGSGVVDQANMRIRRRTRV